MAFVKGKEVCEQPHSGKKNYLKRAFEAVAKDEDDEDMTVSKNARISAIPSTRAKAESDHEDNNEEFVSNASGSETDDEE